MRSGKLLAGGIVVGTLIFGVALWWYQTQEYYERVTDISAVQIGAGSFLVRDYNGLDGSVTPLKLRGCFTLDNPRAALAAAERADEATLITTPAWFDCFNPDRIAADLESGAATAVIGAAQEPYGFTRYLAVYPDGRAFQWRQLNDCGEALFKGDPLPTDCPMPPERAE